MSGCREGEAHGPFSYDCSESTVPGSAFVLESEAGRQEDPEALVTGACCTLVMRGSPRAPGGEVGNREN